MVSRRRLIERIEQLERATATVRRRLDEALARLESVEGSTAGLETRVAPASEIERLNLAFDELAGKAPASEVERLNRAFEELAGKAPASEVERLNRAFEELAGTVPLARFESELNALREELAGKAPASEVERLNGAFEQLGALAAAADMVLSERSVEIPWVLSCYRGERRVLEIGYANAEPRYVEALRSLEVPELVGIDVVPPADPASFGWIAGVRGDIRAGPFRDSSLQLILLISTIEHIGRDNRIYGDETAPAGGDADFEAIRAVAGWLEPGGRLLVSVPFGRFEDHGWLINYDAARLDALVAASGLQQADSRYYEQRGGWVRCEREELSRRGYRSLNVPHAGGVALLELHRPGRLQA